MLPLPYASSITHALAISANQLIVVLPHFKEAADLSAPHPKTPQHADLYLGFRVHVTLLLRGRDRRVEIKSIYSELYKSKFYYWMSFDK